ncbi:MAG TPA: peptidoglycan DD-metalloendopeptidase family protein, partial [Mycobacteriales bacterium]|nr:peptidoglycan DD-metalloendopeptidase family protein [Mycobacteriales bacterium]
MSSLFSARRSPAARLRTAYRRHRSTPRRGIAGPVVLALAIATAGHHVAAEASSDAPRAVVARAEFGNAVRLLPDRPSALLGEPVGPPSAALRARAVWPAGARTVAEPRTPARASRATARTAVAKPRPKAVSNPRWVRPSGGPLTSPYGRRWGRMHEGLDFGAGHGSPVKAAFDGVIVGAGYEGGYGKQIRIRHAGGITTTYSHLSKFVRTGGRVKAGDVIGKIGSTGSSTGPHLHFEVL